MDWACEWQTVRLAGEASSKAAAVNVLGKAISRIVDDFNRNCADLRASARQSGF